MDRYNGSIALYEEAQKSVAGGVTSNARYGSMPVPLFFSRAHGCRIEDVDGNVYVDYILGNGPAVLGHAPPAVNAAVADSLALGQTYAGQHRGEVAVAERLCAIVPSAERVRFASSGSEAAAAAVRLARAATGRLKIVKFEGHYHGWLDNLFISCKPSGNEAGPDEAPQPVLQSPGQAPSVLEDVIILRWNDADQLDAAFAAHGHEIAAVLMEPVMCNAGVIPPRPGYLATARELTAKYGAVLVFDEVITGFRVGLAGAQGRFGITPDVSIFAKAIAGGFPLAAIAGKGELMDRIHASGVFHGGTYNGNVLSMAAAATTLDLLTETNGARFAHMEQTGRVIRDGLAEAARRHGFQPLAQGYGGIFMFALRKDDGPAWDYRSTMRAADMDLTMVFVRGMQERGIRTTTRGTWFMSTAHGMAEAAETVAAADETLAQLAQM